MAFINFGYASSAVRSAASAASQYGRTSPPFEVTDILKYNTGSVTQSQIASLVLFGSNFDFLWGCHLWADSKHKVSE